jgi:hypothetical protein
MLKFSAQCNKFVKYNVPIGKHATIILYGLRSEKEGYIYKWVDYNEFEDKLTKVPKNAKLFRIDKKIVEKYFCGSKIRAKDIKNSKIHKGCKKYLTHDNGNRPFLVCIKDTEVSIYKIPETTYQYDKNIKDYHYTDLIKKYTTIEIFIGKSPMNDMTRFSGGFGPKFTGNSILLHCIVQSKDKYVFIGDSIYEFTTTDKDKIVKYISPVGNNDVPYPFAIGEKFIYFMLDKKYSSIKYINDLNKEEKTDLYSHYYGHKGDGQIGKKSHNMKGVKKIKDREFK